jgi:ketosteroid isomerase-like protein
MHEILPSMAEAGADLIREMLDAFNRGDADAVVATFAEDCELHEPPEMPDRPDAGFRGHAGIRAWMRNLREFGGVRFEPITLTPVGEAMLAELDSSGRGPTGGVPFSWTTFAVIEVRDARLTRVRAFLTRAEAVAAARAG